MKKIGKIILGAIISFFVGAGVLFFVLVCYGIRYKFKSGAGQFAFAVNGKGVGVDQWQILTPDQIIFVCVVGGSVLLIADLVWMIIKLIQNK